jgi:hypothetical protein
MIPSYPMPIRAQAAAPYDTSALTTIHDFSNNDSRTRWENTS